MSAVSWADAALVIAGGALGAGARWLASTAAAERLGGSFAWGTMLVNLAGCFLIGVVVGLADRAIMTRGFRVFLATGFLGGFTPFSTFSLESLRMFTAGLWGRGVLNLSVNVLGGLALTALGLWLAGEGRPQR